MGIILFGAGYDGIKALREIGEERIDYFIDNSKEGKIEGKEIKRLQNSLDIQDKIIFITSYKYKDEMAEQLIAHNVKNFFIYENKRASLYVDKNYNKQLDSNEWGTIYNDSMLEEIIRNVNEDNISVQSKELLKLTSVNEKVLEIGCGSGETSIVLAKNSRKAYALDYSEKSIELVDRLCFRTGYSINTFCADATKELNFNEKEFDVVFQAGLLEHFNKEQRIHMLYSWKKICKRMISLIPNAHSLAYRMGKNMMEKEGSWQYGLEMPQGTLIDEFIAAGYKNIKEYTIGERHSLNFLPPNHYLRIALEKWLDEYSNEEIYDWGQGYLLVTIGENL